MTLKGLSGTTNLHTVKTREGVINHKSPWKHVEQQNFTAFVLMYTRHLAALHLRARSLSRGLQLVHIARP